MHVNSYPDDCDRSVANVLIGKLDPNTYIPPYLVNCEFIKEPPNNENITSLVEGTLGNLGIKDKALFKVLLSDQAAYMVKAGKNLKEIHEGLLHISCLVHGLHRVAEEVRAMCKKLHKLITAVKQIYNKSPKRKTDFKAAYPEVSLLPLQFVSNRWGTWLAAVVHLFKHFDAVYAMVMKMKDEDAAAIPEAKKLLEDQEAVHELSWVAENLEFIPNTIKAMEEEGLTVERSLELIDSAKFKVENIKGNTEMEAKWVLRLKEKFESVLEKNPDIGVIRGMSGEQLNPYKYCPVTSVDCERSFR